LVAFRSPVSSRVRWQSYGRPDADSVTRCSRSLCGGCRYAARSAVCDASDRCRPSPDAIQRLVEGASWFRVRPSVFQLWRTTSNQGLWLQRLSAAALWLGDAACVSHRAAARLRGLDGADAPPLEFSTNGRRRTSESGLVIHRVSLDPGDVETFQGFRVTSVARTVVDLSIVARPEHVEQALESALRLRSATLNDIDKALERSGRSHKGRGFLRSLVAAHPGRPAESALEVRVSRLLIDGGLPPPVRQYEVRHAGRLVARVDFAYPDVKLALEADGYQFHASAPDWRRDRERQNALTRLGWVVYRITWDAIRGAGRRRVVTDIGGLLARTRAVTQNPL